jgi:hypothetical protein
MENQDIQNEEQVVAEEAPKIKKDGSVGPVIGSIIIIVLLVLGGIYYFTSINTAVAPVIENEPSTPTLSDSTEIEDIEKDLEETTTDDLDEELADIESEIDAALSEI